MHRFLAIVLPVTLAATVFLSFGMLAGPHLQDAPAHRYGYAEPLPRTEGAIRIATYNVLNLFDDNDDPAQTGEFDDLPMATADDRARRIAEAIRNVDADVIALQEVESLEALRWFRDTYLPDIGYEHIVSRDVGYYRGIECSVMSRFPITDARTWPHVSLDTVPRPGPGWEPIPPDRRQGLRYQRSPLLVTVRVPEEEAPEGARQRAIERETYELTLMVLHHKSGRDFRWHREAEAAMNVQLLNALREADPQRNIIVLGDFNAAPWDKSLRFYLEAGFIDTLAHRIIPRWSDPMPTTLAEERLFKTHESDRVIDYILLNSAAHREFIVGSAHVYGTLTPPDSYDWRTDPHPPGYASDHYPVIVDLVPDDRL